MAYGERIKQYRELRHMTQDNLARQADISSTSISRIEHGTRKVTLEEAVRFVEILGISLPELAGLPDFIPPQEVKMVARQCIKGIREAVDDFERTLALQST